jgi:hypothetical protein
MDTGVWRDFIIVITGGLFLILLILAAVLAFLLYREIKALNTSIKGTIQTSKQIGSEFRHGIKTIKALINLFNNRESKEEKKPPSSS